jgi:hypothetical protein
VINVSDQPIGVAPHASVHEKAFLPAIVAGRPLSQIRFIFLTEQGKNKLVLSSLAPQKGEKSPPSETFSRRTREKQPSHGWKIAANHQSATSMPRFARATVRIKHVDAHHIFIHKS